MTPIGPDATAQGVTSADQLHGDNDSWTGPDTPAMVADAIVNSVAEEAGAEVFIDDDHWPGELLRERIAQAIEFEQEKTRHEHEKVIELQRRLDEARARIEELARGRRTALAEVLA